MNTIEASARAGAPDKPAGTRGDAGRWSPVLARDRRHIALWLLACCGLVFCMVVLGGVTRLTGSGLSMVQWRPVSGVLPPLGHAAWQKEFDAYKRSPEYRFKNYGMRLDQFKRIFWFEYGHRLLGRTIGLVFLLPFLWFLARRRIERRLAPQLVLMFVLGALQGVLGWYMVKSGLVNDPHVSHYRLTAHLAAALVIYLYMLKVALGLLSDATERPEPLPDTPAVARVRRGALALLGLAFLTVLSGGLVAGLRAGFAWNTFPLMDGHLVPPGVLNLKPLWLNVLDNAATVQFDHRLLATTTFFCVLAVVTAALRARLPRGARHAFIAAGIMVAVQVTLGISTLLLVVPVPLAAAHQGGAVLLLTTLVVAHHSVTRRRATTA